MGKPEITSESIEAMLEWVEKGERLVGQIDARTYSVSVALAFRLGVLWACRPWRDVEAKAKGTP